MRIFGKYRAIMLAAAVGTGLACTPAAAADLAVHKALYGFRLVSTVPGAGISGVRGEMYYEQEATCDAWTTEHRFTTEYQYGEGRTSVDTSRYVAFESKDQQMFSFSSERQENGEPVERLRGSVERAADGAAKAVYSRPSDLAYDLPQGYLLPTAHTVEVIRHARAGDNFFDAVLFDGTDADGPAEVGTFIGKKVTAQEIRKIAAGNNKIDASLLTPDAWHVRMAVFPLKNAEESTPAYEMDVILHDNGVTSYALVDYKEFSLEQKLTALEKLPVKKCH
jgi:hypothetical protein